MKWAFAVRVVLPLAILAVCVDARADTVTRSFDATGISRLVVETDAGVVEVRPTAGASIGVDVDRRGQDGADLVVDFSRDGADLVVIGRFTEKRRNRDAKIRFDIAVPANVDLDLSTAGGKIVVGDTDAAVRAFTAGGPLALGRIGGNVNARTSGGRIRLAGGGADVELRTSGGSIHVGDVAGNATVGTSGGSIKLGRIAGNTDARTSGGSIRIEAASGAVRATTSGGNVSAAMLAQPVDDSRLSTSGGSITLVLAENIAADIEARTRSRAAPTSELQLQDARVSGSSLRGSRNGGGPEISLHGNSVSIEKP